MKSTQKTFFDKVYEVTRQIPRGRVASYGAIARFLGTGSSSRMVGWAMNNSHTAIPQVPAHRVVNRNGCLTGKMHFATTTLMQEMLEQDGLIVIDDQVQDFSNKFWDPQKELYK
jgi:methylated-DNA-protein-cysteine methyltransferase related protein